MHLFITIIIYNFYLWQMKVNDTALGVDETVSIDAWSEGDG